MATHLCVHTAVDQATLLAPLQVVLAAVGGEAPVAAGNNLLAAGELELGTTQGLSGLKQDSSSSSSRPVGASMADRLQVRWFGARNAT